MERSATTGRNENVLCLVIEGQPTSAEAAAWNPCLEPREQKKDQVPRLWAWAARTQNSGKDFGSRQGAHAPSATFRVGSFLHG